MARVSAASNVETARSDANGVCRIACGLLRALVRGLPAYAVRVMRHSLARYAMNRARRRPDALVSTLKSARSVLIVCHGNIIRSAFAAGLVEQELGDRVPVAVRSAGTHAGSGNPPHPFAVAVAGRLGVDLSRHVSARLTPASVEQADAILVMDIPQVVFLARCFPEARKKTFLLTGLAPDAPLEVVDPFGCDEPTFHVCFGHIAMAVRPIVRLLSEPAHSRAVPSSCDQLL